MDYDILELINVLLDGQTVYLSHAMRETNSTQRQVIYRLEKINSFLNAQNFTSIYVDDNKQFYFSESVRNFLISYLYNSKATTEYYLNKEERMNYIYLLLFISPDHLSLSYFTNALKVSKTTFTNDFKLLTEELQKKEIKVEYDRHNGYFLVGSESRIRNAMMEIVLDVLDKDHNQRLLEIFIEDNKLTNPESVRTYIRSMSKLYNIDFVDNRLTEFVYIFVLLKRRALSINDSKNIIMDLPYVKSLLEFEEYQFSQHLINKYYDEDYIYKDHENQYLTSWIVGVSIGNIEVDSVDIIFISNIVGKIIRRFQVLSGVNFENEEEIFRHVYAHMRPSYYRMLFGHPISNKLTTDIKTKYSQLFCLVEETMKSIFKNLEIEISDSEIAYICLHFHSIYPQLENTQAKVIKGLIICLNGVGSSAILYNELVEMFPNISFYHPIQVEELSNSNQDVDIIFTTHYFKEIENLDKTIIKVSPIMSHTQKSKVLREVDIKLGLELSEFDPIDGIMEIVHKYHGISENDETLKNEIMNALVPVRSEKNISNVSNSFGFIDMIHPDMMTLNITSSNPKEILEIVGKPLVKEGFATQNYLDTILNMHEVELSRMIIAEGVCLPHTVPIHGALKHGISIGVLKEPVLFGTSNPRPVEFIFFLSAPNNHSHIGAMAEFLELLRHDCFYQTLKTNSDKNLIIDYIAQKLGN